MTNATAVATLSEPAPAPDFRFRDGLARIADAHRPSRHPFFAALGALPAEVARDRRFLGRLHLTYQATMHATRAMVYHLPYLDSPALRIRKVGIFVDDDGLAGGDTHHYQLTRAFRRMGARLVLDDEDFGDLDSLCRHLEPRVAGFVQLVKCLYPRSLGPWCIVELLSDGWMRALAAGLARHFPGVIREPYFADCFTEGVEERHAAESLEITEMILARRPELLPDMLADARVVAEGLDDVWDSLHDLVRAAAGR